MTFHLENFVSNCLKKYRVAYILTLNPILSRKMQERITNNNIDIDEKELYHHIEKNVMKKNILRNFKNRKNFHHFFQHLYKTSFLDTKSKNQLGGGPNSLGKNIKFFVTLLILLNNVSADLVLPLQDTSYCNVYEKGTAFYYLCSYYVYIYNNLVYLRFVTDLSFEGWMQHNNFRITEESDEMFKMMEESPSAIVPNLSAYQLSLPMPENPRYTPPVPDFDRRDPFIRQLLRFTQETQNIQEVPLPEGLRRRPVSPQRRLPAPEERLLLARPPSRASPQRFYPMEHYLPMERAAPDNIHQLRLPLPQEAEYVSAIGSVLLIILMRVFSTRRIVRLAEGYNIENDVDDVSEFETPRSSSSSYETPRGSNVLTDLFKMIHATNEEETALAEYFAASNIQRMVRGRAARSELGRQRSAAVRLQSLSRGQSTRRNLNRQHSAATRIQSLSRGHSTRKKYPQLMHENIYSSKKGLYGSPRSSSSDNMTQYVNPMLKPKKEKSPLVDFGDVYDEGEILSQSNPLREKRKLSKSIEKKKMGLPEIFAEYPQEKCFGAECLDIESKRNTPENETPFQRTLRLAKERERRNPNVIPQVSQRKYIPRRTYGHQFVVEDRSAIERHLREKQKNIAKKLLTKYRWRKFNKAAATRRRGSKSPRSSR